MPQIIGVWCKEEGHQVKYSIFTGSQDLKEMADKEADIVFISSFTYTAQLAYALSNYFRSRGIVTVLGGPHARCYPEDSSLYFDYVLGLTDRELVKELLYIFQFNKGKGGFLSASSQPSSIPGIRERWEFIEMVHRQFSFVKSVQMIGSFGCHYKCDFCPDSEIQYQSLDQQMIKEDLQFLGKKMRHPVVSWYDPNFGVNFNSVMETIESAVTPGTFDFVGECTLTVLSEANVKRLSKAGFKMIMPGIESWFDYGKKSKTGSVTGLDKVREVADHVNMIQRYIPQVQTNFMIGLDCDAGKDPFELTKRFIDLAPAAYPSYALLSVYGRGVKTNIKYELDQRIIPFPFHMLRSVLTINIIPKNYTWEELYIGFIDLLKYSFSAKAMYRRFNSNRMTSAKWITLFLSATIGGSGKIKLLSDMMENLKNEPDFQSFVKNHSRRVPASIIAEVKNDLGPFWYWLPNKDLSYNTNVISGSELPD